jgi:ribosomal protein S12 methylthiotransferase accessory factor YcaO
LYPRCKNYEEWLNSRSLEHYYKKSNREVNFDVIPDISLNDLKANIKTCISILNKFNAEVIVVDLSIPEMTFPVVRVLVTNLQPLSYRLNLRLSQRLFTVPVSMKYRKSKIKKEDLTIRELCGYENSLS